MKIEYDKESDILMITLKESKIKESDEINKGVIVDYDYSGNIVRIEILYATLNIFPLDKISIKPSYQFEMEMA
ncbi:MAG: hypothetical protein HW421_2201 [Ignavibacteria bacterium]|nr:hypothetical protein [Ignavibacteria bacterium]